MSDALDTIARTAQPFFQLPRAWRPLAGFGFGLREPAIIGVLQVSLPAALDFGRLDADMARSIPEKLPQEEAGVSDSLRLVRRAIFWAGGLQRQANIPVFGQAYIDGPRPGDRGEEFRLAVPTFVSPAATTALEWVGAAINNFLLAGQREAAEQRLVEVMTALKRYQPPGINIYRILMAAHALDIPAKHLMQGIFCLGTGARLRWLQSSLTERTSLLGSTLAGNKMFTADLLRRAGLPAATHVRVRSPEEAVTIARRRSYPVVVKPADRQQGVGVAANLESDDAVADAYRSATRVSKIILVEKHFEGNDFRLVVVDGKLFGVTARLPGGVVGDGEHTILELVELENRDPVRVRRSRERGGTQLAFDDEARVLVAEAGRTPDSIPAMDEFVRLRRRANISAGGSGKRMEIHEIHPDNARLAERAANALRLDLAGVDLLIPDITRSWMEVGALICEVNPQPQIGFRSTQPLIEQLFNKGSKIPVVLLVSPAADIAWQTLQEALPRGKVGYSSASGVWLGAGRIALAQKNGLVAGEVLLNEQEAEAALIHMAPDEIGRLGLPCDSCDTLVIAAPDSWDITDRNRLVDIIAIAKPNAKQTIYTTPSRSSLAGIGASDMRGTDDASLQEVCATLLRAAIVSG